jgi:choline dehydrogenase
MVRLRQSLGTVATSRSATWSRRTISLTICIYAVLLSLLTSTFVQADQQLSQDTAALITSDPANINDIDFDHIVVGGGLAGMVMASRLSEDRDKRVLLIEAGNDTRTDPLVRTVRLDNAALQVQWQSRPQIGGATITHSFGIGLGGSTSINGAKVDGPPSSQIDAFREFGNPSWSWEEILHYMKKSQNYHEPHPIAAAHGATYDPTGHGVHGPVDITFSPHSYTGLPQQSFVESLNETLGVDKIIDAGAGEAIGYSFCPHFIKHGTNVTRESSATAYFSPIEYERSNLVILTGWRGIRVNWQEGEDKEYVSKDSPSSKSWAASWQKPFSFGGVEAASTRTSSKSQDEELTAKGITVQSRPDGPTFDLHLREDNEDSQLTISTGALVTPLLLELSGVGDPGILSKIGIKTKINLPGVGRNLADKPTNILAATTRGLHRLGVTGDPLPAVAMLSIDKILPNNVTQIEKYLKNNMHKWARHIVREGGAVNVQGILRQYEVMMRGIFRQQWPVAEWEYFSRNLIAIKSFVLQPFSRGFIHSKTRNSVWNLEGKDVDLHARVWTQNFDMDLQVASMEAARTMLNRPKMRALWKEETKPGLSNFTPQSYNFDNSTIPASVSQMNSYNSPLTDKERKSDYYVWREYILKTYDLICHNFGTAAMMRREWGGVVDEEFKVYGTKNLRVVDASIFPMQLSAHPSLAIFGVAEKAADLIRRIGSA